MKRSGNALFLILIAVALFAALSYAVTQSGRGGGNIDRETSELAVSELVQYFSLVEGTVQKLLLFNGCNDTQISFWNDSDGNGTEDASDDYFNSNSPSDRACHVFQPQGGGISPKTGYNGNSSALFVYSAYHRLGSVGQSSPADTDLAIYVDIPEDMCRIINTRFTGYSDGFANEAQSPAHGIAVGSNRFFDGGYSASVAVSPDDGDFGAVGAQDFFRNNTHFTACHRNTTGVFSVYHVLIAR
ncbi:MAG: hypothetical protein AAFO69_09215 [Bacteroidota bacterium]